ncbi:hypothetical protein HK102_010118, partial [Quaeritorhiza haematococci]
MVRMLRQLLGPSATIHEAADGTEAVDFCAKLVSSDEVTSEAASSTTLTTSAVPVATDATSGVVSPSLTGKEEGGGGVCNGGPSSVVTNANLVSASPPLTPLPYSNLSDPAPPHTPADQLTTIPTSNPTTATSTTTTSITTETTPTPNPLAVIFMDIIMPTMDGYTASQHIRNMGIKTPIVVTTANMPDEEKGREVGVVEVVRKPFTKERVK